MGWLGSALIIYGWWAIGNKWRHGLMAGVIGSGLWTWVAYQRGEADLFTIENRVGFTGTKGMVEVA